MPSLMAVNRQANWPRPTDSPYSASPRSVPSHTFPRAPYSVTAAPSSLRSGALGQLLLQHDLDVAHRDGGRGQEGEERCSFGFAEHREDRVETTLASEACQDGGQERWLGAEEPPECQGRRRRLQVGGKRGVAPIILCTADRVVRRQVCSKQRSLAWQSRLTAQLSYSADRDSSPPRAAGSEAVARESQPASASAMTTKTLMARTISQGSPAPGRGLHAAPARSIQRS